MTKEQAQAFKDRTKASWNVLETAEDKAAAAEDVRKVRADITEQIGILTDLCVFLDELK